MSFMNMSTQHVYRGRGEYSVRVAVAAARDATARADARMPTIADTVPATRIMSRDVICARDDLDVDALVDLMVRRRIGCMPVVDRNGCPIGMVTKQDLVEQLLGARDPEVATATAASQLMMPLAFSLGEHATIAHAAALMCMEGVHHVPIVGESGCLIGVVSTYDIVRWLAANDGVFGSSAHG